MIDKNKTQLSAAATEINVAHFDCQFGAAGDMLVAALLDAGIDRQQWLAEVNKIALPPDSFRVRIERVSRCGIEASKVEIDLAQHQNSTDGENDFVAQPDFNPTFKADHHQSTHGRFLQDIQLIIANSPISEPARGLALRIFQRLAAAEAKVHGVLPEEVHFHELGAVDAIVDIVGFAIAYDMARIGQATCTALPLGAGVVQTQHGIFPVPAPAVVNLLADAGAPASDFEIPFECLTPTGAAILCEITGQWSKPPAFSRLLASGYGAGSKNPPGWPNVSRVLHGTAVSATKERFDRETIAVVETNIDDQSPQAVAFAVEQLFVAGALDVLTIPASMKKGRSGYLLMVLCRPELETTMEELIIQHTSSLGVRSYQTTRAYAERKISLATLENGTRIRIKSAMDRDGKIVNVHPEFDDLAAYARREGISLKEAHNRALLAFSKHHSDSSDPASSCDSFGLDDTDKVLVKRET